jgi:hypothetical protein
MRLCDILSLLAAIVELFYRFTCSFRLVGEKTMGNLLGALSDFKCFSDFFFFVFLKDASMNSKLIHFLYVVKR